MTRPFATLDYRRISPSQALVWVAPPGRAGRSARSLRVAALRQGAAPLTKNEADALAASVHELSILDGDRPGAGILPAAVEQVREWLPGPVLRVEVDGAGPARRTLGHGEAARLAKLGPLFLHVLVRHPHVRAIPARHALARWAEAGLPLAADVLLERGVNDDGEVLATFLPELMRRGVRPYHLINGAWLPPERVVPPDAALTLVRALRGWISGMAVPQLVSERIDGRREVVIPPYVRELNGAGATVENYRGEPYFYPHLPPGDG